MNYSLAPKRRETKKAASGIGLRTRTPVLRHGATTYARRATRVSRARRSRAPHALAPRRLRGCRNHGRRYRTYSEHRNPCCRAIRVEQEAMSGQDAEIEQLKASVSCAALL